MYVYKCVYMYIYICVCVYIFMYTHVYVFIYRYIRKHTPIYMYIYFHICTLQHDETYCNRRLLWALATKFSFSWLFFSVWPEREQSNFAVWWGAAKIGSPSKLRPSRWVLHPYVGHDSCLHETHLSVCVTFTAFGHVWAWKWDGVPSWCNTLQHTVTNCNTLHHATTNCNMLQ